MDEGVLRSESQLTEWRSSLSKQTPTVGPVHVKHVLTAEQSHETQTQKEEVGPNASERLAETPT